MKSITKHLIVILILLISYSNSFSQFYNGLQMDFGKNRVQYNNFFWSYYRFDRFDTYFHTDSRELVNFTSKVLYNKLTEIENYFEYSLQKRLILVIYNKQSNFKQSNIGLESSNEDQNIGGVTKIIDNKVFVYYEGDHEKFEKDISAAIAEVVFNEMYFGGNIKDRVTSSGLQSLPDWFTKGLISYVSNNWNIEIENKVKDGILNGKYEKIIRLQDQDAVYAGHSLWRFVAENYGKSVIPNIIYLTKINRNYDDGFLFVLGASVNQLVPEWIEYYKEQFEAEEKKREYPENAEILKRPRKKRVYQQLKKSPKNTHLAYTTNKSGKYKIWLYDTETQKAKKIYKKGHTLEQITDYSYPLLSWHPSGDMLAIITEHHGSILLLNYYITTGKFESRTLFSGKEERKLFHFEKIHDFAYSPNGLKLIFSASKDGLTDIFVYSITSNTSEQITKDFADDHSPRFIENGNKIIFSSNRVKDTIVFEKKTHLPTSKNYDLFVYDYKNRSKKLTRITKTPYVNETNPFGVGYNVYTYLTDNNGIINREIAKYDSTISFIDTITHYRYFTTKELITNYARNITDHDVDFNGRSSEILYFDKKYHLYQNEEKITDTKGISYDVGNTGYMEKYTKKLRQADSLKYLQTSQKSQSISPKKNKQQIKIDTSKTQKDTLKQITKKIHPDSMIIDINNYVFDIELTQPKKLAIITDSLSKIEQADTFTIPKIRIYQTTFYIDELVSQVDFSFLNTSYQAFTGGGPVYFNPGGNVLLKVGVKDLFENYRIVGGIRLAGNFDSNEYLFSFENLKKRFDKQFIYHRQTLSKYIDKDKFVDSLVYIHSNNFMHILKFPLDEVRSIHGTASIRYDNNIFKSQESKTLKLPGSYNLWSGLKLEYIFDNTKKTGLNLYNGTRYKIFGEYFQEIVNPYGKLRNLFVLGCDFRHYQKIHRSMIFASRFAASTSFGRSKLLYYLGGVDNWMNFTKTPTFIDVKDTPINNVQDYAFQTVATNMRGFSQNIRNGNSFALINTEIRWPIVTYIFNRPVSSDFLNNLQIVGFADIGSAWSGLSPMSKENAYNTKIIENGPVTVIIDKERAPFVAGFGWGLRSRLLGYFIRLDYAWGIEDNNITPRILYLSLDMDF